MHHTAKVFKLNIFGKMRWSFWAIFLIGIGFFLFSITPGHFSELWFKLFSLGLVLVGIFLFVYAFRYQVILDEDSVTVAGAFCAQSLKRCEVKGRRQIVNGRYSHLFDGNLLVAMNSKEKNLTI